MNKIILASSSPRRQQILNQIGVSFEVIPSTIHEVMDYSLKPSQVAVSLASQKCEDVALRIDKDCIVIAADTIVVKDGRMLGKPKNEQDAYDMLKSLNGQWHEVITGISLHRVSDGKIIKSFESTKVKMAQRSDEFLRSYIATGEPFDKAGAYGIQGYGSLIVEKVEGCYFNVMGLPVYKLSLLLDELGYKLL
ncbi:MAG TPA: Maf family protein [Ruminiclostridium sp.]|nr:Maf family protein [Ruminiclostridium sp.]